MGTKNEKKKTETPPAPRVEVREDIREIKGWEDVDAGLGVLRLADARIATITAELDTEIQALQEKKQQLCQPYLDRRDRVAALVEAYVTSNRADVAGKKGAKSRKLVHGIVGWKMGNATVVFVNGEAATKKLIQVRGHTECIVTKEDLDKAKIKDLPDSELRSIGVRIDRKEAFFYKLNTDAPIEYPGPAAAEAS